MEDIDHTEGNEHKKVASSDAKTNSMDFENSSSSMNSQYVSSSFVANPVLAPSSRKRLGFGLPCWMIQCLSL